jgi:hypothetical protein
LYLTVSRDFLAEIGRIAVMQAHVEALLGTVIENLTGVPAGDPRTLSFSFRKLVEHCEAELKHRAPALGDYAAEAAVLLVKAKKCAKRRNEIVHSMWAFGPDFEPTMASHVKRRRGSPKLEVSHVRLEDLREVATEMEALVDRLTYIYPHLKIR